MTNDIFPERSQAVAELLGRAGERQVLIVPVDFAKKTHVARIVRGTGEYLGKRPFSVRNDAAGVAYLAERIEAARAKYRIPKGNVVVGGEDPPEFAQNFALGIEAAGYLFVRVNATEAKRHRANSRATSDALALDGIAEAIRHRRGYDMQAHDELYGALKAAERARRSLRKQLTATKSRIHKDVDLLCPGLLDKRSGLPPFGPGSLALMESGCSALYLRTLRPATLAARLAKAGTQRAAEVAEGLVAFARSVQPPDPALVPYRQRTLTRKIGLFRSLETALADEGNEMARCLVQSPGFLLTSVAGLGIVLAGGIVGEYGDPDRWPGCDPMMSYAGLAVRQHQTGGPDSPPVVGKLPRDANHYLKDLLLQAAFHVGTSAHPVWRELGLPGDHPLREHYERLEQLGRHSRMGTVKKLLRIARTMMHERRAYLPDSALDPCAPDAMPPARLVECRRIIGRMLVAKWKPYDLGGIPDESNQLQLWLRETDLLDHFLNNQNDQTK
jgi:transposase